MSAADTRAAAKQRQEEHGGTYQNALAFVMAQREVDAWNAAYPIGTSVIMSPYTNCPETERLTTVTRSVAWVISNQASVMIEGKSGGYGLAWVKPIAQVKK